MKAIVVGGGAAGMSAASRIRRLLPNSEIKVFEESGYVSYAPCGVPYYVEGLVNSLEDLVTYTPEFFRKERKIEVYTHSQVLSIDAGASEVRVLVDGKESVEKYDYLVLATGALPIVPDERWLNSERVFTIRHLEDGERVKLYSKDVSDVAIVGGGYIGVEMAEAMSRLGKRVSIFEMKRIMPLLDQEMSSLIKEEMKRAGVKVYEGFKVESLEDSGKKVIVSDGSESYSFDAAIIAVGVRPNSELARRAGIRLGQRGGIDVDTRMKTSVDNVYAAGDNVEVEDLVIRGRKRYVPLAPEANKEGYVAGSNIGGRPAEFPGSVGAAVTKFNSLEIGTVGINEEEAKQLGIDYYPVKIQHNVRASYYPPKGALTMKVIFDKGTKVPLGAQIVGEQVWGRLVAFSLAIQYRLTAEQIFYAGIPYAPPFAPVWDSTIIASRIFYERS